MTYLNLGQMIKYVFASNNIIMFLSVFPMHHIPTRDNISTEVANKSIPNFDVENRSDSIGWTGKVIGRHRLWSILQCIQDGAPVMFVASMTLSSQMPIQGIAMNSNATFSTNWNLPSLIVANDSVWMERWRSFVIIWHDRIEGVESDERGIEKYEGNRWLTIEFCCNGQ